MSIIISFFKFIGSCLAKLFDWVVSLPGLVITLITSVVSGLASVWSFLSDKLEDVVDLSQTVQSVVTRSQQVLSPVLESSYFELLNYCLSLHLGYTYVSTLVLFILSWFGFVFFTVIVGFSSILVIVFSIKMVKQIVSLATAGFSKL